MNAISAYYASMTDEQAIRELAKLGIKFESNANK